MPPKVSVVMSTYNRAHLLERSLIAYEKQALPLEDLELIICDDWSTDDIDQLLRDWSTRLNITVIRPPYKQPGVWRSEASVINVCIRASRAPLIIGTHPEVIPGKNSLVQMWEHRQERTYHCCKIYYLTQQNQIDLDTVDWQGDLLNIRQLPNFYEEEKSAEFRGHADYTHSATEKHTEWGSWVFGGGLRSMWQAIGGLYPFKTWGSADPWFFSARPANGVKSMTELDETTFCVHQNHDDPKTNTLTPRDMNACMKALEGIPPKAEEVWL